MRGRRRPFHPLSFKVKCKVISFTTSLSLKINSFISALIALSFLR